MLRGIYSGGVRKQNGHYQSNNQSGWKVMDGYYKDYTEFLRQIITPWDIHAPDNITGMKQITIEYYTDIDYVTQYPATEAYILINRVYFYLISPYIYEYTDTYYLPDPVEYDGKVYSYRADFGVDQALNGKFVMYMSWDFDELLNQRPNPSRRFLARWQSTDDNYPSIYDSTKVSLITTNVHGTEDPISHKVIPDGQLHTFTFDFNYSLRKADFMKPNEFTEAVPLAMQLFPRDYKWGVATELGVHLKWGGKPEPDYGNTNIITIHYHIVTS